MRTYNYSNDLNLDEEKPGSEFLLDMSLGRLGLLAKVRVVRSEDCNGCFFNSKHGCIICFSNSCCLNHCKYKAVGRIKR